MYSSKDRPRIAERPDAEGDQRGVVDVLKGDREEA